MDEHSNQVRPHELAARIEDQRKRALSDMRIIDHCKSDIGKLKVEGPAAGPLGFVLESYRFRLLESEKALEERIHEIEQARRCWTMIRLQHEITEPLIDTGIPEKEFLLMVKSNPVLEGYLYPDRYTGPSIVREIAGDKKYVDFREDLFKEALAQLDKQAVAYLAQQLA